MKKWNPFGKVDMEIGSFLKASRFNKVYGDSDERSRDASAAEGRKDSEEAQKRRQGHGT